MKEDGEEEEEKEEEDEEVVDGEELLFEDEAVDHQTIENTK